MHLGWYLAQILVIGCGKFSEFFFHSFKPPASVLAHICEVLEREMYKNICRTKAPLRGGAIFWCITPQKVVRSRVTPQKTTPKFQLFWPFLAWFLGQFSPRFRPLLPRATTLSIEIWTQGSPNIGLLSHKISAQTVHVGLSEKPWRVANQMHFFRFFVTFLAAAPTCLNAVQRNLTPR